MILTESVTTLRLVVAGCDYITTLGLEQLLSREESIEVVGAVDGSQDVLALMAVEQVDLVLVDAGIAGEMLVQTCRTLTGMESPPAVVVMGNVPFHEAEKLVFEGVSAILHHGLVGEDLPVALRLIHKGGALLLSDAAREALLARESPSSPELRIRFNNLKKRERVVAEGIAEGMTNRELAASMHMSEATVKLLVSQLMNKLGVGNRVQIAVAVTRAHVV